MRIRKNSQLTLEFLVLVGFLFIITVVFIAAIGRQMTDFSDRERLDTINAFGNSIKTELDIASIVKDGYQRSITLPDKIDGRLDYTITVSTSTLIITSDDHEFVSIIPKTQGTFIKGSNIIRKQNNTIVIENV